MFRNQRQIKLSGAALEEGLERGAHGTFMGCAEAIELVQCVVVVFYDFVCWSEVEACHRTPLYKRTDKLPFLPSTTHVTNEA